MTRLLAALKKAFEGRIACKEITLSEKDFGFQKEFAKPGVETNCELVTGRKGVESDQVQKGEGGDGRRMRRKSWPGHHQILNTEYQIQNTDNQIQNTENKITNYQNYKIKKYCKY